MPQAKYLLSSLIASIALSTTSTFAADRTSDRVDATATNTAAAAAAIDTIAATMITEKAQPQIFTQHSDNLCGFASVLNALRFGTNEADKRRKLFGTDGDIQDLDRLVAKYGAKPSTRYATGTRLRIDGISNTDMLEMYNDVRHDLGLEPLSGGYLSRNTVEPQKLAGIIYQRLQKTLDAGEPPIVAIRSQVAGWDQAKGRFLWRGVSNHAMTVVGLSPSQNADGSFTFECVDSALGRRITIFAYIDPRNFAAPVADEWVPNRPFLTVCGSSVFMGTNRQNWNERTLVYLNYMIYKQ